MMRTRRIDRREFISTAAATVGAALVPGAMQAQDPFVDVAGKSGRQEGVNWKVVPFPMSQVRLRKGPFMDALEADRRYLLMLPQDRLLHTFRVNAGLASSAVPFGGWESPDCELRGHFTGGHYLSACALMYASTGDEEVKKRGDAMVAELAKCQAAARNGYLSAFPLEFFDRLREGRRVWAPFYTYHKIMAGHLDMYVHCGNQQALEVAEGMAGWVRHWQESISDEHMQRIL